MNITDWLDKQNLVPPSTDTLIQLLDTQSKLSYEILAVLRSLDKRVASVESELRRVKP